jgi:hypothetical protein
MADNVTAEAVVSAGVDFATDDISDVHYPITKITIGALNSQTLMSGGNGTTDAGTVRVTISSDSTGVLSVDDNGGSLTVDGTVTANLGATDNAVLDSIQTAVEIIDNAVYVDDADWTATSSSHNLIGGVYQSTPGAITDGDTGPIRLDANGAVHIADGGNSITIDGTVTANLGATDNAVLDNIQAAVEIMDDWDETNRAAVNTISGQVGVAGGSGTVGATTQRVTLATDVALPAGTNAIGKLTANTGVDIGDVDVTSISAGANLIGDVGIQGRTSGGLTMWRDVDLDETAVVVKASAGQIYTIIAINLKATTLYLQLYDVAQGSVTVGTTTPDLTIPLPANSTTGAGVAISIPQGIAFATAITAACTTGHSDAGAPGANECIVGILYK